MTSETFPMVPAQLKWLLIVCIPAVLLLVGGLVFLVMAAVSGRATRFEVSSAGLQIRAPLGARLIAAAALRGGSARALNLDFEPALMPTRRSFGVGLPGYRSGWFQLRSGEKALLHLTDRTHVVYVPTNEGFSLLLSTPEPARMVAAIQQIAPAR